MTILVTAIGSVAGEYVIETLKKLGHRVVGCDIYEKRWLAYADSPDAFYQVPLVSDVEEYSSTIHGICVSENVNFIFPLTDIEVDFYNFHREWFNNNGIVICISPKETIQVVRDKYSLMQAVARHCTSVKPITTMYLNDFLEDTPDWGKDDIVFVAKPVDGRSSQGVTFLKSFDEVAFFSNKEKNDKYIIQPYIAGSRIVVDVVRQPETGITVCVSRKELLSTTNGCGTSVYVYKDTKLNEMCCEMANKLEIVGCVNFEFICDYNGDYYLLECNPRFSAGVEFSALAGCDFVEKHLNCFRNLPVEGFILENNMYIARKWTEVITAKDNNDIS